ncbi:MAG: hypothetical protein CMN57_00645 [Gammaproteobacteria bacterium]|nr:hypothetical protein [Gammaproteobacteria bacterium]
MPNPNLKAFLLLALLCANPPLAADELQAVMDLARAGAHSLALQEMDARQPAFSADPSGWIRWEQERLYILELRRDWAGIAGRVRQAPAEIPESLARDFVTRRAEAELELGRTEAARQLLRRSLWEASAPPSVRQRWRRLLIRGYLQAGAIDDARAAMQRYQLDYADTSPEWYLLGAQVLLRAGQPGRALELLEGVEQAQVRPYRWLARLQSAPDSAGTLAEEVDQALASAQDDMEPLQRARLWAVRARADAVREARAGQVAALEAGLGQGASTDATLFELSGEALWDAYLAWGAQLGNAEQLLIGQDQSWYFAATESMEQQPRRARALFAVLALQGQTAEHRSLAHDYLARLVLAEPGGGHLLHALYLDSSRFARIADIPAPVRYLLVDLALDRQDLETASALMQDLAAPAQDQQFAWQLRRARVLVLNGRIAAGVALLEQLLADQANWQDDAHDRFLQVVFDLQRLKEHEQAIALLARIDPAPLALQGQRELLFWLGESYAALDQHRRAAVHFLRSAILADPYAMDPWAQTARYHAARALAAAGLQADAASLLRDLLRVTRDSNRRDVLRHELQQLEAGRDADRSAEP